MPEINGMVVEILFDDLQDILAGRVHLDLPAGTVLKGAHFHTEWDRNAEPGRAAKKLLVATFLHDSFPAPTGCFLPRIRLSDEAAAQVPRKPVAAVVSLRSAVRVVGGE